MFRVLFVCSGNTCRSPMAQSVLRREVAAAGLESQVLVESAGLRAEVVGAAADPRAEAVLGAHGYRSEHAVRQFDQDMFDRYDMIIGLDSMHVFVLRQHAPDGAAAKVSLLGSFDPAAGAGRDIPDPVTGDIPDYERALRLVQSAMPGLLATVRHGVAAAG